jgi:hypothetical protein
MRGTLSLAAAVAGLVLAPAVASAEDVNLAGPGFVPVTVADGVDAASVQLAGQDASVTSTDVSGRTVLQFAKQDLGLTAATTSLPITGTRDDGSAYHASQAVTPTVVLEVKTTDTAAITARYPQARLEPMVRGVASSTIKNYAATAKAVTGRTAPDMADWYLATFPAGVDVSAVLSGLTSLAGVQAADPAPSPAPPPSTPDFSAMQTYLRNAPVGISADFSRMDPRARGAGIKVADLEYYWNSTHEDLQLTPANDLGGTQFPQYTAFGDEHGTGVFGEIAALDNGYGVTGGVPDVSMNGISPTMKRATGNGTSYVPASALTYVAQFLHPGDVVLIEQQTVGPDGGTAYVPLEWTQSGFDAIKMLSDMGVVVVETGGNGYENLDQANMNGLFDRSKRDSGAIVVGAGSSGTDHTPLAYSSWGSRVDLQGVGQNVVTTGFNGNLFGGTDPANLNVRYTRSFSGTSSSGPIVADAVVAVESYLKNSGKPVLTPTQVSDLLKATGTPQSTPDHHVGPLPDIEAALKRIEVDAPAVSASFGAGGVVTLTGDDGWGSGVATIEYRADGGAWTTYTGPFTPAAGTHVLSYRATDKNGNVGTAASSTLASDVGVSAGGSVPATLALTLGGNASFGSFIPGVAKDYTASTTATVTSTAGDAALSASGPGHLTNGAFSLASPLQVALSKSAWSAPVSNDNVSVGFTQSIGANEALRTGTYSATVTLTLSTTLP